MVTATVEIKGKEYTLTELEHADWLSLRKYYQYRDYHQMKRDAEEIPELQEQLPEVLRECSRKKVTMADIQEDIMAFDVVVEIAYLSLRKYHKDISRDDVAALITTRNQQEVLTKIMDLSGLVDDDADSQKKDNGAEAGK